MRIAVLGAGAWGTALAAVLAKRHSVSLWARSLARVIPLETGRESTYLPGIRIPPGVDLSEDLARALEGSELALAVVPTAALREVLGGLATLEPRGLLLACKGFELGTSRLPHEVAADALPSWSRLGVLSGPSFALEVAQGLPAALTVASHDAAFARDAAAALHHPPLRIYSSADVVGVELGGALKNVIAIAAGICDGLGLGANARAALITRGLAEMARLGVHMGGEPETFMGLAGLGDLVLTTTGDLSRNRAVGLRIARGTSLERIKAELGHVAEGVPSARAARELGQRLDVDLPITEAVCAVLFEGRSPLDVVGGLLAREARAE